jgi:hypothetical protein
MWSLSVIPAGTWCWLAVMPCPAAARPQTPAATVTALMSLAKPRLLLLLQHRLGSKNPVDVVESGLLKRFN